MTSLFRQGVETVCKGERENECASPWCRRKSRWGWGWGEGLNTELWAGLKGKAGAEQCQVLKAGSQGSHFAFMCRNPLLPPGV